MWIYEREMPWEKGERKPFIGSSGMPPSPLLRPMAEEGAPTAPPPARALPAAPAVPAPKAEAPALPTPRPPKTAGPKVPTPPPRPAPAGMAPTAPTALPRKAKTPGPPGKHPAPPVHLPGMSKPKPGASKRKIAKKKPAKPAAPAPFGGAKKSEVLLEASFPEMEAAIKKSEEEKEQKKDVMGAADDAPEGDPLLSDSFGDEWAAGDSFRQKRKELTRRHEQRMRKRDALLESTDEVASEDDPLLAKARGDEWAPSDSGKLTPMRELQGLGAHDEDQFEDEEGEGLGTRILAREADDMERDAVDEEFFSDIDISNEDYAEAAKAAAKEAEGGRSVRKLEETQFLDYQKLVDSGIFSDTEFGVLDDEPLEVDAEEGGEGLFKALPLNELDFARALARVPSRRLLRLVEGLIGKPPLPAEPVSKQEFEALFG